MAPLAAQRAALEKDGRSDAETVFRGESLDTSDVSCDMSVIYVHFLPCVPYCSRRLNMVRRAVDQVVLALFIKFGKVGHISGNTHDEASVILGVFLCRDQRFVVHDVYLHVMAAVVDKGFYHAAHDTLALFSRDCLGVEAYVVERSVPGVLLFHIGDRVHRRGGAVDVAPHRG
ncbi:hypothetical protein SDC9_192904 [bioreactor metagenome]|uniref:Uncharacterized protein n=1 Tax=bioreactor metagenome TaxID=1076179 RepID=A0A645I213_9ZZZZ